MGTTFTSAPEVKTIAEELIQKYHPSLRDFAPRIEYVFTDKTPKKGGKEVWGTMRKITNLAAFLAQDEFSQEQGINDPFFVMTITKPVWDILQHDKRVALVDHELCHAVVEEKEDGKNRLLIVPHDLEEFTCIVKRHGLWREDVQEFADATQKPSLNQSTEDTSSLE